MICTAEYSLKENGVSKSLRYIEETLKEFGVKKRDLLENASSEE